MLVIFFVILIISIAWAYWSMRDFELPKEVQQVIRELRASRIGGVIVRFKQGFQHYNVQSRSRNGVVDNVGNKESGQEEKISSF